ncbi:MAG: hypothetical protein JWP08_475 [Bryobacterales bacterium]|nr:hypothetical protein [Bryobacterales bacterium]
MTALQRVDEYLRRLELRLRLFALARGAAIAVASALLLTVVLVWIGNERRFASEIVLPLRVLLFAGVAAAVVFALAIPLSRINRRRVIRLAEAHVGDFKERLLTVSEKRDPDNPFTELIAEDALRVAQEHGADEFVPGKRFWAFSAVSGVAVAVLLWLMSAGPGFWGYGAALLWTGTADARHKPLYEIAVQPGNKTIRRKSDQPINAQLLGFSQSSVTLHAKYRGSLKWETIPMQAQRDGNGYEFIFAGLSDVLDYYVQAGATRSKNYTLSVKDLPMVKRVRVGLHYPSGIGLQDVVEDPGGDIRAVQGTGADISVLTDRKLGRGVLVLENGKTVELKPGGGNWLQAHLAVNRDGSYHVAAIEDGETIRISDDYFIEARKDEPPSIKITRPGRDPRVSPIEELPVTIETADDFGVNSLELHYSVNGGPEQTTSLLKTKGKKEAAGKTTLFLENMNLTPGDVVSLWATARDVNKTSTSDILFAHAEPFDYKFRQSQQSGGGGGGGSDESSKISERQKEIIAATWNQLKDPQKEAQAVAENARFLSDLEGKLGEQSKTLAERMGNRDMASSSPQFEQFSKAMNEASGLMGQAVEQLKPGKWKDALSPEEKALQSLLHAESIFRDIQVSFGKGGSGSGGGRADQDLARMFDLELDTAKNQYETGQKAAPPGGDQQKQMDEALQRLKDLARRQQELADQQRAQQSFQQRWEEEQLRREAEELRQQMQQLARNGQQSGQSASQEQGRQQAQRGQQGQSGQRGQQGQQSGDANSQAALQQAMDNLQRAEEEMRNSVSNHDASAQRRAAQQLAQAQKSISDMMGQRAGSSVSDLARKAQQLAENQKDLARRVKQQYGAEGINTARSSQTPGETGSSVEMPEMAGPGFGGYSWRRRTIPEDSARPTTGEEKALAAENEKLAEQVQQLQQQMQQQSHGMQEQQPEAAKKLRKALSDAEQQELALRMQKSSEWMRRGYGSQTWPMQDSITAGMDQLNRQLQEAQQALGNDKTGEGKGSDAKMAETLAQVRSLRQQLENRSQGRSQGNQPSQSSQSEGSQSGESQADGGTQRDSRTGSSASGSRPTLGGGGGDIQQTLEDLAALRAQVGRTDRRLSGEVNDAIGLLQHMKGQDGLLDQRVNQDAVASLEKVEVELNRRIGQGNDAARTGTPETAPEQYRDAVAEYFKRLSK